MDLRYTCLRFFPRLYARLFKLSAPVNRIDLKKLLLANACLKEGSIAIDAGAHVGYFSRYFSSLVGATGLVYAIEPNPYICSFVRKYLKPPIQLIEKAAASESNQEILLFVHPYTLAQNTTVRPEWMNKYKGPFKLTTKKVKTIAIDDLVFKTSLDFIKIDVEGHEEDLLKGARQTIDKFNPVVVFEYGLSEESTQLRLLQFFEERNYRLIDLNTSHIIHSPYVTGLTDIAAIPASKEKLISLILSTNIL